MKRYQDPAIRGRGRQLGGKVARAVAEAKRAEAEERQARTLHQHTRAHRLGQCACWLPQRAQSRPGQRQERACPWPGKVAYTSPQEAARVLGKHARWRRWRQGLNIYPCGDHYHAGRLFGRVSAWARAA